VLTQELGDEANLQDDKIRAELKVLGEQHRCAQTATLRALRDDLGSDDLVLK
jgi:hypothetical protein